MRVLVINSGSASVKYAVIEDGKILLSETTGGTDSFETIVSVVRERDLRIDAIAHRIVHGGRDLTAPVRIDDRVIAAIEAAIPLAPLHNPANLEGIRAMAGAFPDVPQFAVFDTAFHRTMPPHAERYAVPESWATEHAVRRYGFQGINHQWVARKACEQLGLGEEHGIIVAHLGNGCSVTAVRNGRSVETTMGFTPLEGLMMGTRSGDVDPAVVPYMAARLKVSAEEIVNTLNRQSGLLGVSERSNDVRDLIEAADEKGELALRMFSYRASMAIGALRTTLERFDALVFTAGIGEHSPRVRRDIVEPLGHLGLLLDYGSNERNAGRIDRGGLPAILVIPAGEELAIWGQVFNL